MQAIIDAVIEAGRRRSMLAGRSGWGAKGRKQRIPYTGKAI